MKKTLITLMALGGVAWAEPQTLTLTNPSGSQIESGNNYLSWEEEYDQLDSWVVSFNLLDSALGDAAIFSTLRMGSGGAVGYVLSTTSSGGLKLSGTDIELENIITAGTQTSIITLSFVANEADEYYGFYNGGVAAGTIVGGTFTLTVGEQTMSAVVNSAENTMLWNGEGHGPDSNWSTRFWTNGGAEKLYNISVGALANNIIPEPATATLSLLALCGLAARRRRK